MYLESIKSKRKGRTYVTHLIRETYRENGKIKHRTISNVSKLSEEHLRMLRDMLRGDKGAFSIDALETGRSREYGASFAFMQLARKLGLDRMIFSRKEEWREDALAMIVGRLVFQGSKLSLTNMYRDTALWGLAGHPASVKPDVEQHCYKVMDILLDRKEAIERKLSRQHLQDGCVVLYDMTNCWFEGEYKNSEYVEFGSKHSVNPFHR